MGFAPGAQVIAGDPRLSRLLRVAHRRLEASGGCIEGITAVLRTPTDDEQRADCMGMLVELGLDLVLTNYNEWGCYPQVPSVAIYHLSGPKVNGAWRRCVSCGMVVHAVRMTPS